MAIIRATDQYGIGDADPPRNYDDGRLCIRPRDFLALADGQALSLTARQLGLLAELSRFAGTTRTREELRDAVWGPNAEVSLRAVDVVVSRVRAKLDDAFPDLDYIQLEEGVGYQFP